MSAKLCLPFDDYLQPFDDRQTRAFVICVGSIIAWVFVAVIARLRIYFNLFPFENTAAEKVKSGKIGGGEKTKVTDLPDEEKKEYPHIKPLVIAAFVVDWKIRQVSTLCCIWTHMKISDERFL